MSKQVFVVLDDREWVSAEIASIVGPRRFGDMLHKRARLHEQLRGVSESVVHCQWMRISHSDDVAQLKLMLKNTSEASALVLAGRAGFSDLTQLRALLQRLAYADSAFCDQLYHPLLMFFPDAHALAIDTEFVQQPLHLHERPWQMDLLQSFKPVDLASLEQFLSFFAGVTDARHFNQINFDRYFYTKESSDKLKMEAEYRFYSLVPEQMRPWLVEPFDFREHAQAASYKMLRYYVSDVALMWIHGALDTSRFDALLDRLCVFLSLRPTQAQRGAERTDELLLEKVRTRCEQFLQSAGGLQINALAKSSDPNLAIEVLLGRYEAIYRQHRARLLTVPLAIGHNDLCFSNILYDPARSLLKLLDPKGARDADALYAHAWYDYAKLSHSVLGDYDFINSGLARVHVNERGALELLIDAPAHQLALKQAFRARMRAQGVDVDVLRVIEASLFLSMLPLHLDHPKKVLAFMLRAQQILNEIES